MKKTLVNPPDLYPTPWKFNQAIKVSGGGSLVFLSGIIGYERDGTLPKDILTQAENAYASLKRVVEEAGGTLKDVVKTNVYVGEEYQRGRGVPDPSRRAARDPRAVPRQR
jgi:enamine deaminase RidA (YjgF/YER057c/UK114 family)